ncbi:MAG TPA: helix-turn-helix transcriptional regulator [Terriglobia bacterium]|nr:helix-turn-helix transcriptional regulator [Terriglobia bacterium]
MNEAPNSQDFARAFGDALRNFLQEKGITQSDAARRLGFEGKTGKARLSTYCHDSPKGKRPKPNAEVLYLVCTRLSFEFEYNGYRISAATFNGTPLKQTEKPAEQLPLEFDGQFDLTDQRGTVSVSFKRPLGRVEVWVSLKAAS